MGGAFKICSKCSYETSSMALIYLFWGGWWSVTVQFTMFIPMAGWGEVVWAWKMIFWGECFEFLVQFRNVFVVWCAVGRDNWNNS